jgi:hypothetical protein
MRGFQGAEKGMGNDIDPYFWGKVASETKFVK